MGNSTTKSKHTEHKEIEKSPYALLPKEDPFDQTFLNYAKTFAPPVIQKHRSACGCKSAYEKCVFVQRIIDVTCPEPLPYTDEQRQNTRFAPVLTVTSGKRTYFMHVPCQYLHRGDTHIPSQDSIFLDSSSEETAKKHTNNNSSNNISNDNSKGNLAPVVVFFSGTDECAFDNEMLSHVKGSQTWLDLSDQEGVILVFAQARGYYSSVVSCWREADDPIRTCWVPENVDQNELDQLYVRQMISDVLRICPFIDKDRIFCIGFSNGGYMACDCALLPIINHRKRQQQQHLDQDQQPQQEQQPPFHFAAVCMYMGGIAPHQITKTAGINTEDIPPLATVTANPKNPNIESSLCAKLGISPPPVYIITGTLDPQTVPCHKAWQCFYLLGYDVTCEVIEGAIHEYLGESTQKIWDFFVEQSAKRG